MLACDVVDYAYTAPFAFLLGGVIGFVLANRYRIRRRSQEEEPG